MGGEAMTDDDFPTTAMKQKAGHQEILGETLAKFEFFQNGWHPYSRFLDIDKVDLILRRRLADKIVYREVQVKFGKLYTGMSAWEHQLFTCTSWRFFTEKDLDDMTGRVGLFLAYVLSRDEGFKGDMFIFPIKNFVDIARSSSLPQPSPNVSRGRRHPAPSLRFVSDRPPPGRGAASEAAPGVNSFTV
jgi:hypothetical protein